MHGICGYPGSTTTFVLLTLSTLLAPQYANADTCEPWAARAASIQGEVESRHVDAAQWRTVNVSDIICPNDMVRVKHNSRASFYLSNDTVLRLDQNTTITFPDDAGQTSDTLDFLDGIGHFISRVKRRFEIVTPFVNATVEGTEFVVAVTDDQSQVTVFEGRVIANNAQGSLALTSGESALATHGQAPLTMTVVTPRDAVQWALYYPAIVDFSREDFAGIDDTLHQAVDQSIAFAKQGEVDNAINALPARLTDHRVLTHRASLYLSVGRIAEARADLQQAAALAPGSGRVSALRAIIAVAQNQPAEALALANEAVTQAPNNPETWLALSYARQARFNIEDALAAVRTSLDIAPDDALSWARAAELYLSMGKSRRAQDAAHRAARLNPRLARTQSVLGFAHLARTNLQNARDAFTQSIAIDSTDPLARLGLGLTKIRRGELAAGRAELELAASLDPNNALIRSYLGKAYYEEKRNLPAASQLDMAKALDPNDPTPWLYDAIRKQTENQPVAALRDAQTSIALNDNRAVYRSRLLLDEDLAARNAGLARVYSDLGFESLALREGWKSLALDPANHSAHRFLADSYRALPRHEVARVSELLQAQLLQPINTLPVQPQLAESFLNVEPAAGISDVTFNEYSPLFVSNGIGLTASGFAGNDGVLGDELVVSGVHGRTSFSIGQFHYESDGKLEGNPVEHDIYNAFAQLALTDNLDVQIEYRYRDSLDGDQDPRFSLDAANPDAVDTGTSPLETQNLENRIARVGTHFAPSPRDDVIISFIHSERDEKTINESEDFGLRNVRIIQHEQEGYNFESQYLLRGNRFNITLGIGAYSVDDREQIDTSNEVPNILPPPFLPPLPSLPLSTRSTHTQTITDTDITRATFNGENAYLYANGWIRDDLLITAGISYDTYKQTQPFRNLNEYNWKFGAQWEASNRLRLRAATAQTLKRPLVVDQTIEPTQVAGFSQFFDDFNGSLTELRGIGLDTRFTKSVWGGIDWVTRNIRQPIDDPQSRFSERDERTFHAYLNWLVGKNWALDAAYRREQNILSFDLETETVPIAMHYRTANGMFATFGATFAQQKKTLDIGTELTEEFAVVDLAIGYRFPRRLGTLTIEAENLFDQSFLYADDSFKTADKFKVAQNVLPFRTLVVRIVTNF